MRPWHCWQVRVFAGVEHLLLVLFRRFAQVRVNSDWIFTVTDYFISSHLIRRNVSAAVLLTVEVIIDNFFSQNRICPLSGFLAVKQLESYLSAT